MAAPLVFSSNIVFLKSSWSSTCNLNRRCVWISAMGEIKCLPLWTAEKTKSTYSTILSPHLLFPSSQVFSVDVHCKSPILVGNLACIVLPMNPLCTKWRARGQVVCLLLIKPFDQSPFSSAHVALWAPPVCSVRQRTLLVQKWSQWDVQRHMCCEMACLNTVLFLWHFVVVVCFCY